jgi:Fur family zinc uptake transcriptional regulator
MRRRLTESRVQQTAMSLTAHQQDVLDALQQAGVPLTAYALLERLRGRGLGAPTQVYRALDKLSARGLVHRLESVNAYVCCRQTVGAGTPHGPVAFAICDACGHADEFADAGLGLYLGHWARNRRFALGRSTIELHGLCADCVRAMG